MGAAHNWHMLQAGSDTLSHAAEAALAKLPRMAVAFLLSAHTSSCVGAGEVVAGRCAGEKGHRPDAIGQCAVGSWEGGVLQRGATAQHDKCLLKMALPEPLAGSLHSVLRGSSLA